MLPYIKCLVMLIFAVAVFGQMDLRLTSDQEARIHVNYFQKELHNETLVDKRSRYLYKIIHSRPENLDLAFGNECKLKPLKIPHFSALKEPLRISDVKCLEYLWKIRYYEEMNIAKAICHNDFEAKQIENVVDLHIPEEQYSEHSHMGAIGWQKSEETWLFICEGALISEKHLLTSASCTKLPQRYMKEITDIKPKVVRLGVYDISDKEEVGKSPTDVFIRKITVYPHYQPDTFYYDLALIEIDKKLLFSSMIHPACIWTNMKYLPDNVLLTGWYDVLSNKTVKSKKFPSTSAFNIFEKIDFVEKPKPEERRLHVPVNKFMMQLNKVNMIRNIRCEKYVRKEKCRGLLYHQQCGFSHYYENSCQLESGTVLQARIKIPEITNWKMHYVFGVRSGDLVCATEERLSVYSKASVFVDWIEKIVWSEVNN